MYLECGMRFTESRCEGAVSRAVEEAGVDFWPGEESHACYGDLRNCEFYLSF